MQLISIVPNQNAQNVSPGQKIIITFDKAIDASSLNDTTVTVATDKKNIVKAVNNIIQPNESFQSDAFLVDEFTGIVRGKVEVNKLDNKQLFFTPKLRLQPNTQYKIYISQDLAATDGSLLSTIKSSTFKTAPQDIVDPIAEEVNTTRIIGTEIQYDGQDYATDTSLRFKYATPRQSSVHNSRNTVKIAFTDNIDPEQLKVTVELSDVLSDYPAEELSKELEEYSVTIVDGAVTVLIAQSLVTDNKLIKVTLDNIQTLDGRKYDGLYELSFFTRLTPYFSSVQVLKLKAGTLLKNIDDTTLALMMFYASTQAASYTSKTSLSGRDLSIIRGYLALYIALESLLLNNGNSGIIDFIKKDLSDFSIAVSTKTQAHMYNTILNETKNSKREVLEYLSIIDATPFIRRSGTGYVPGRMWRQQNQAGINSRVIENGRTVLAWDEMIP